MPGRRPMNLQHVQLGFCPHPQWSCGYHTSNGIQPHISFWESIHGFRRLRVLRLELEDINTIAVQPEKEDALLSEFPDLKLLEVKGSYGGSDRSGAALVIANLLCCCPSIQKLDLKFTLHGNPYGAHDININPEERKAQLLMEECVESLKKLKRSRRGTSPCCSAVGDWRDDEDLSALKARSFPCLQSHLRKIRLEFVMKRPDCFEAKIAKFLVENADVLEEMEVHDGDQRVYDHIHHKLAIWRANSSKSRINIVGSQEHDRIRASVETMNIS